MTSSFRTLLSGFTSLFKNDAKKATVSYIVSDSNILKFEVDKQTNLLEALQDAQANVSYSCRAGQCQSCVMQVDDTSTIPVQSQAGLSAAEKNLGYFLPCVCVVQSDMSIRHIGSASAAVETEVISSELLPQNILILKLRAPFSFKAGQFCNLFKDEKIFRSYSIASKTDDDLLEFHIKAIESGKFSSWAKAELKPGDKIRVQGPYGKCIYTKEADSQKQNLLLAGIGTGLAPLIGVIKDALGDNRDTNIDLVLGSKSSDGFYLSETLEDLSSQYPNLSVHWLHAADDVSDPKLVNPKSVAGDIYEFVKTQYPNLSGHRVFLCGAESFVKKMKKTCYLNDASLSDIMSDVFTPSSK